MLKLNRAPAAIAAFLVIPSLPCVAALNPRIAWQVSVPRAGALLYDAPDAVLWVAIPEKGYLGAVDPATQAVLFANQIAETQIEDMAFDSVEGNIWMVGLSGQEAQVCVISAALSLQSQGNGFSDCYAGIPAGGPYSISADVSARMVWVVSGGQLTGFSMHSKAVVTGPLAAPDGYPIYAAVYMKGSSTGPSVLLTTSHVNPGNGEYLGNVWTYFTPQNLTQPDTWFEYQSPSAPLSPVVSLKPIWDGYQGLAWLASAWLGAQVTPYPGIAEMAFDGSSSVSEAIFDDYSSIFLSSGGEAGYSGWALDAQAQVFGAVQQVYQELSAGNFQQVAAQFLVWRAADFPPPDGVTAGVSIAHAVYAASGGGMFYTSGTDGVIHAITF